jgi:hypothetical protein
MGADKTDRKVLAFLVRINVSVSNAALVSLHRTRLQIVLCII